MKKILVISTQLKGGCYIYADMIMSNLKGNVEIAMPAKVYDVCNTKPHWTFKYHGYPLITRIFSFISLLFKVYYKAISGKYDSLLLFGITNWDYYILRIWTMCKGKSFVVIHDGKMHVGEGNDAFIRQTIKIMDMSNAIIYLSEYVKDLTMSNFRVTKPYIIAPHGLIDYGQVELIPPKDRPTLLFLGRISKYKGVELLLEALEYVDKSLYQEVIIAGKWSYEVPYCASDLKVKTIDKWLTNTEIIELVSMCDIMIFPYLEASQSGVATIAINYIKPSVVTDVGAFREQFPIGTAIFSEPNATDLAEAISQLCKNSDVYRAVKENLKILKQQYSWEKIANDLEIAMRTMQF